MKLERPFHCVAEHAQAERPPRAARRGVQVQKFFGLIRILCCNVFSQFFVQPGPSSASALRCFAPKELHVNVKWQGSGSGQANECGMPARAVELVVNRQFYFFFFKIF